MKIARLRTCAAILALSLLSQPARATDLIVSGNEGKRIRLAGVTSYPQSAPPDSLAVIDASRFPPSVKAVVEGVEHTVAGPPQAVAITPDGKLAILGAPTRYDLATGKEILGTFLQIIDLEATPPRPIGRVEIGVHSNGLAISPDGRLLLAAGLDGTLKILSIAGKDVSPTDSIRISDGRLSGVSFTHDGKAALVAQRDEGGLAVLRVGDGKLALSQDTVSTGIAPYVIDVSADGKWAVAGSVGLAGLAGKTAPGDADIVTLIDVSRWPFRAVQHLTVPSVPEGIALSPDGRWIAVQAMDGSNLGSATSPQGNPKLGKVILFAIRNGTAVEIDQLPSGEASQGIVFARDSKTILVQFAAEKALAVYQVDRDRLVDTGRRLKLEAGPVSIRSMPR